MPTSLPTPANFECSYNGWTFDPVYTFTTGITAKPIEDASGHTTTHSEITISLKSHIHGADADTQATTARRLLSKVGGKLVYIGRSLGDFKINTDTIKDIAFGPKPGEFRPKLLGDKTAIEFDWSVTVRVPDCSDAVYSLHPMEISYSVEFQIGLTGRTTRSISGELKIPNNRETPTSRKMLESPDDYREQVAPPLAVGFRREWMPWVTDITRTRLNFGWKDSEFEGAIYPEGIVSAKASHSIKSLRGLLSWTAALRADYTMAATADKKAGEKAFAELIRSRFANIKRDRDGDGKNTTSIIVSSFEMDEPDIYGPLREVWSVTYMVSNIKFKEILAESGIWAAVPGDHDKWQTSLQTSGLHPRGSLRMAFKAGEDAIVDLCGAVPTTDGQLIGGTPGEQTLTNNLSVVVADTAWIKYQNNVTIEADSGTCELRSMPIVPVVETKPPLGVVSIVGGPQGVPTLPQGAPGGADGKTFNSPSSASAPASFTTITPYVGVTPGQSSSSSTTNTLAAIQNFFAAQNDAGFGPVAGGTTTPASQSPQKTTDVQRRTAPACTIIMYGEAMRAGFAIPCPQLTDIEGVKPVAANRTDSGEGFTTGIIGNAGEGVPMYGAKWRLRYFLESIPVGPISAPPNPMHQR